MISASKSTLNLNNLKILRPKVTKNLTNLHKKFCEFPPSPKRISYDHNHDYEALLTYDKQNYLPKRLFCIILDYDNNKCS